MAELIPVGGSKVDAYHNEFLDTSSLLAASLRSKLNGKSERKDESIEESFEESGAEYKKTQALEKEMKLLEAIGDKISDVKDSIISLFQNVSQNEALSIEVQRIIKKLEGLQKDMGTKYESFDPLKNMSGLKSGSPLENADKTINNTLKHYRLFGISSIRSFMSKKGPAIELSLFGSNKEFGFEISCTVVAEDDFNGNEAIDYVLSHDGGLLSVKARVAGSWNDVSENYIIKNEIKKFRLSSEKDGLYSLFLGEKIINEGKEEIKKVLKIDNGIVEFGKCRAFSKDKSLLDSIKELVQLNK